MSAVTLNLKVIRPLDVLLTTGTEKSSGLIRTAQLLDRGRRAEFSHAALFISPTLLVEADTGGIDFCNLLKDTSLRPLAPGGGMTLAVDVPGVTRAVVLRHQDMSGVCLPGLGREALNAAVQAFLWDEYPNFARLLAASRRLPDWVARRAAMFEARFGGRRLSAGPFCSELVALVLQEFLAEEDTRPLPAPSDFAFDERFCPVSDAVLAPGTPGADLHGQEAEFLSVLQRPFGTLGGLGPTIMRLGRMAHEIADDFGFPQRRAEAVASAMEDLGAWLDGVGEPLWAWFGAAAECYPTCPSSKPPFDAQLLRLAFLSPVLQAQQRRIYESRCSRITSCRVTSGNGTDPVGEVGH